MKIILGFSIFFPVIYVQDNFKVNSYYLKHIIFNIDEKYD